MFRICHTGASNREMLHNRHLVNLESNVVIIVVAVLQLLLCSELIELIEAT